MNIDQLTNDAFNGKNESLYDYLKETRFSYEQDGEAFPSNGLTKAQVREGIISLTEDEIEVLEALGVLS